MSSPSRVPERIGPYEILSRLPGYARLSRYLARDANGNLMSLTVQEETAALPVFPRQEIEAILRFRHTHAVPTRALQPGFYFAEDFLEKGSLWERCVFSNGPFTLTRPLPPSDVMPIIKAIASALDAAHAAGIVHGAVEPEAILLTGDSDVAMLAHFGMARLTSLPGHLDTRSPDAQLTARSDQYSLAVVAHWALMGHKPSEGWYPEDFPESSRLSPGICAVLERARSLDPNARYESCTAFVRALSSPPSAPLLRADRVVGARMEDPGPTLRDCLKAAGAWE
jgi:serine/threonine kinase PknH